MRPWRPFYGQRCRRGNKEGFSLVQHVEADFVVTTLYHAAGRLSGSMPVFKTESGPQAYGSALTYARRYGVTLLLGICADDDDDANAAEGNEVSSGHPNHVLTPEKRDKYLPKAAEAINNGDPRKACAPWSTRWASCGTG